MMLLNLLPKLMIHVFISRVQQVPSYVEKMTKEEKPNGGTAPAAAAGSGYVEDGTVDLAGNPVLKAKTGGWKACPFILCTYHYYFSDPPPCA